MTLTNDRRTGRELNIQTRHRRSYSGPGRPLAVRKITDASTGTRHVEVRGQAIGFGRPYQVFDGVDSGSFTETIHYGACRDLLLNPNLDVAFLIGHDAARVPISRTGARSALHLNETPQASRSAPSSTRGRRLPKSSFWASRTARSAP